MIRRYYATKDNTITNAFEENLTSRGTGSNMGASDIVEVFSIYAQATSGSSELARILIQFDTDSIISDRSAGLLPASGSVSWHLSMYNAPHSQTVPSNFTLEALAVSTPWEEGYGLDMEFYEDETKGGIGSNWINASGTPRKEITRFEFKGDSYASGYDSGVGADRFISLYSLSTVHNFYFSASTSPANAPANPFKVNLNGVSAGAENIAEKFRETVDGENLFSASRVGSIVYVTASSEGTSTTPVRQGSNPFAGSVLEFNVHISGATNDLAWTTIGGDYHATPKVTQTFSNGLEDLSMDVSDLVEQWIAGDASGGKENYGLGIKLTNEFEAYFSSSTGQNTSVAIHNTDGQKKSFFRKKFFGRDTEFHFQKPVLEARWDSSRRDDRGYFYASSSLASAEGNLNTTYLYNRIRGRLRDIPIAPTSASLRSSPTGANLYNATASRESTGIYKADLYLDTAETTLYDVWWTSGSSGITTYHTGTIAVKSFEGSSHNPETLYVLSMPRLQRKYRKNQTHRLDLYTREKNWSPNIYTTAIQSSIPSLIIPSASYQIRRSIDDYVVVPYGTGSILHTGLSYDVSGNYFDLDTTYLEAGYLYEIQYSFYDEENGWEEQPYRFKFRVVD